MTTPIFLDTSALLALLDAEDLFHDEARPRWERLLDGVRAGGHVLSTHYAVVVETSALIARRLGPEAVRQLHDDLLPIAEIVWINDRLHRRATAAMFAAGRRDASLVDWLSFEVMRRRRIRRAFTYHGDFGEQGFGRI